MKQACEAVNVRMCAGNLEDYRPHFSVGSRLKITGTAAKHDLVVFSELMSIGSVYWVFHYVWQLLLRSYYRTAYQFPVNLELLVDSMIVT